jgi:methyl-accepting chemotaxis protein
VPSGLAFRHKMVLPAAAMVAAALVASGVAFALSRQASQELTEVERQHAPALELARDLEEALQRMQRQLQDAVSAEDPAGLEVADAVHEEMHRRLEQAAGSGLKDPGLDALQRETHAYALVALETSARLLRGEKGEALATSVHDMRTRYTALRDRLAADTARARAAMAAGFQEARDLQERSVLLGTGILLVAALAAAALAWWLAAGLARPLEALQVAARRIAEGDLTVPIEVTSDDEVGALAASFRGMAGRLREIIATLRASSGDLSSAAADLEVATRAQTALLERQASGVSQTTTTTRQLEQTSGVTASRASSVLEVARRAAEFSEQGQASAAQSAEGIRQIQDAVGRVVAQATRLRDQAQAVGEIVETVKDLATQSHVLSLNASIEAVRAGEAGKGFAVVAAEVRALAEQSGQAAARIGRLVQEILGAIQATLDLTERSRQGMEGSLGAVRASGESLGQIGAIVKETADAALQIATAVQQQSGGVGQIAGAMRDLNAGMEETLARIQALEQAATHLRATSGRISDVVSAFRVE